MNTLWDDDLFTQTPVKKSMSVSVGDIWQLDKHTLHCDDSLTMDTHSTAPHLIWSDPPYGINAVKKNGTTAGACKVKLCKLHTYEPLAGDKTTDTAIKAYRLFSQAWPDALHIWWGANYYSHVLPPSRCWIVWDKLNTGDFADAELAWSNDARSVRVFRHMWNGAIRASEKHEHRVHPTQKPIALAEWCFKHYSQPGASIFDPFVGSGISILAAERLGDRTVYGYELSPHYCAVTLTRWERMTGKTAYLLQRRQTDCDGAA